MSLEDTNHTTDTTNKHNLKQPTIRPRVRSRSTSSRVSLSSHTNLFTELEFQEAIDKLALPKSNHGSQDSINGSKYVSMAETVKNFQNCFRGDIGGDNNKFHHLRPTVPQSPALMTKKRSRPVSVPSKDQRERKEMEDAKK